MKIKILGCSGGIGVHLGGILRTTSILVDDDILIDAGTGVSDLSMSQLMAINHIFITHSHLDHITSIPFLLDSVMGQRTSPVILYGLPETLQILKDHIFNWKIWPDFNVIPVNGQPIMNYQAIETGESIILGTRKITALPANHVVPAVGYCIDNGQHSLVFSGDTTSCDAFWQQLNTMENLRYLLIETAYSNADTELAGLARHLCPSMLLAGLSKLQHPVQVYITHLKPGGEAVILQEIAEGFAQNKALSDLQAAPLTLRDAQVFEL